MFALASAVLLNRFAKDAKIQIFVFVAGGVFIGILMTPFFAAIFTHLIAGFFVYLWIAIFVFAASIYIFYRVICCVCIDPCTKCIFAGCLCR